MFTVKIDSDIKIKYYGELVTAIPINGVFPDAECDYFNRFMFRDQEFEINIWYNTDEESYKVAVWAVHTDYEAEYERVPCSLEV